MKLYLTVLNILLSGVILLSCSGTNTSNNEKESVVPKTAEELELFFQSALDGRLDIVKRFVDEGVEVNSIDGQKRTALMLASFNGHTDIVKFLIVNGANIDMVDEVNRTALMFASTGPFNETVVELIRAGSDVNAIDGHENWTPLMFAAGEGQLEVVKTLISNGADPTMLDTDGESALDFAQTKHHQPVVEYLQQITK